MDTATAPPPQQAPAGNAIAHAWSRLQLPLFAAPLGGAVGVVGAYLYWTIRRVLVRGETMAGDLLNFGFGSVRLYVLLLALLPLAHGLLLLLRPGLRNQVQGGVLGYLGFGLLGVPVAWMFVLVTFNSVPVADVGPGAWVPRAGGVIVWRSARSLRDAPAGPPPAEWPRRSAAADIGLLVVAEVAAFVVFLHGVEVDDPSAFLGFFVATVALGLALSRLGVLCRRAVP